MSVSEHADTEEFRKRCQCDSHDQSQTRCSQRDRQFCRHKINLHSLKQSLKDIPFAHESRLRGKCGKTHGREERADSKQHGCIAKESGLPDQIAFIDCVHTIRGQKKRTLCQTMGRKMQKQTIQASAAGPGRPLVDK